MIDKDQLFAEKLRLGIDTYVDTTDLESIFFNDQEKEGFPYKLINLKKNTV